MPHMSGAQGLRDASEPQWQTCWKKGMAMLMIRCGRRSLLARVLYWLSPLCFSRWYALTMVPYLRHTTRCGSDADRCLQRSYKYA